MAPKGHLHPPQGGRRLIRTRSVRYDRRTCVGIAKRYDRRSCRHKAADIRTLMCSIEPPACRLQTSRSDEPKVRLQTAGGGSLSNTFVFELGRRWARSQGRRALHKNCVGLTQGVNPPVLVVAAVKL